MKLDTAEQDEGYFQPVNRRVDQSIGLMLTGLCAILVFLAFVVGILQSVSVTTQSIVEPAHERALPASDIGGNTASDQEPAAMDTDRSQ